MSVRKVKPTKRKSNVKRKVKRASSKSEPLTKVVHSLYRKKQCVRRDIDGRIVKNRNDEGDFSNFMGF